MKIFPFILVFAVFVDPTISDSDCNSSPSKSTIFRLKQHILCGDNYHEPPVPVGTNTTSISLILIPTLLNFDEDTSNLELHSLLYMEWMDDRLKWDATLFDNISKIALQPWRIWTPELTHRGAGIADVYEDIYHIAECWGSKGGQVVCILSTVYNIRCETDFTRWPYDRQNCTLVLALWSHTDQQFKLAPMPTDPVMVSEFGPNQEWSLDVIRVSRDLKPLSYDANATTMALTIDFVLDRTTGGLRGQFVSPALILMVMTIVTAYLEPLSIDRIVIACLNVMVHLLCIQNLTSILPHNGTTIPNILLFYCDSMIFAIVALVLTFVLAKIEKTDRCPPKWMTSTIVRILRNKYGQVFLLSIFEIGDPKPAAEVEAAADDNSTLVDSESNSKNLVWRYVTVFFIRTSCCIYIVAYLVMYIVLIYASSVPDPIQVLHPTYH